jgi:hypothetical protein
MCLRFLADEALSKDNFTGKASSSLQEHFIEETLSEQLCRMMTALRTAGCEWRWELGDIEEVAVRRLFVVVGGSRGGTRQRGPTGLGILGAFGQQFVLSEDQYTRFIDKGMKGRMDVLQELLFSDSVLVGDVAIQVKQRCSLSCDPKSTGAGVASTDEFACNRSVTHVLRLEMALNQIRNQGYDDIPHLRASSWQIADWNWLCVGNHPALPPGVPSPW